MVLVWSGEPTDAVCCTRCVCTGVRVPPSLVNIYKELAQDVGAQVPKHGCLQKVRACAWVEATDAVAVLSCVCGAWEACGE